jgi:8-oxo-dGTP diphosphatase
MRNSEHRIRVVAAVIAIDGRYLVCQRPHAKRHGGLWEFPGGKVAEGESDLLAVRRELLEELGVEVREIGRELFTAADPDSIFDIAFIETVIAGEPRCIEHVAIEWATADGLHELDLAPTDRRFVDTALPRLDRRR